MVGTTNGTFQGQRYFNCQIGCGLFVSLHQLSPISDIHLEVADNEPLPQYSEPVKVFVNDVATQVSLH